MDWKTMPRMLLLAATLLCFSVVGCSSTPSIDEKQYQDFLTAARDWQEKVQGNFDKEDWRGMTSVSRMQDIVNLNQTGTAAVAAQKAIIEQASTVSVKIIPLDGWAQLGRESSNLENLKTYYKLRREAEASMRYYVAMVDCYSKRDFAAVKVEGAQDQPQK